MTVDDNHDNSLDDEEMTDLGLTTLSVNIPFNILSWYKNGYDIYIDNYYVIWLF